MGLPVIQHPTFSLTLPSTKQKIHFRPFLVKEEKLLLIAQSSDDQTDIIRAIKQVITNCITDTNVNVEKFTTFDLEYFFVKLRAKSVQNIVSLSYRDNEDNQIYEVTVNLDEVEVTEQTDVQNKIEISGDSGIMLKYPQLDIMNTVEKITDPVDFNFAIMEACIDCVYQGDNVYKTSDFTREEVKEFIDSLDVKTYQAIQKFIEAMPRLEHTVSYVNSNDKKVEITLRSLTDFFTLR